MSPFYGFFRSFTNVVASYVKDRLVELRVYVHTCFEEICVMSYSHYIFYLRKPRFLCLLDVRASKDSEKMSLDTVQSVHTS